MTSANANRISRRIRLFIFLFVFIIFLFDSMFPGLFVCLFVCFFCFVFFFLGRFLQTAKFFIFVVRQKKKNVYDVRYRKLLVVCSVGRYRKLTQRDGQIPRIGLLLCYFVNYVTQKRTSSIKPG